MSDKKTMVNRFCCALLAAAMFVAGVSANAQQQDESTGGRMDLAVTYNAGYANIVGGGQHFWLNGGSVELGAQVWRGLGIVADITGLHTANTGFGVPLNVVTTTFGPRYRWVPAHGNLSLFGQGLIGEAHGFSGVFPNPTGPSSDALSFASQVGGGADLRLSRHLSLRLVQADWLRTQLPNSTTNVQNDLRLGTGLVLHSAAR